MIKRILYFIGDLFLKFLIYVVGGFVALCIITWLVSAFLLTPIALIIQLNAPPSIFNKALIITGLTEYVIVFIAFVSAPMIYASWKKSGKYINKKVKE